MPSQPRACRLFRVPDAGAKTYVWSTGKLTAPAAGAGPGAVLRSHPFPHHRRRHMLASPAMFRLRACALRCDGVPKGGSGVLTTLALLGGRANITIVVGKTHGG